MVRFINDKNPSYSSLAFWGVGYLEALAAIPMTPLPELGRRVTTPFAPSAPEREWLGKPLALTTRLDAPPEPPLRAHGKVNDGIARSLDNIEDIFWVKK